MPPKAMPSKGRFTPQWPSRPNPRTKRRDPVPEKQGLLLEVPTKKAAVS